MTFILKSLTALGTGIVLGIGLVLGDPAIILGGLAMAIFVAFNWRNV